jgi:hypothetical protein
MELLVITIPGPLEPLEPINLGERFVRPVVSALRDLGCGELDGFNTHKHFGGDYPPNMSREELARFLVTDPPKILDRQDIYILVSDLGRGLAVVRQALIAAGAPVGTVIYHKELQDDEYRILAAYPLAV